ncbi:MAG: Lrp/AsnC family transcriptional regulator [Actinobacteria bacterium]|nr:Lrp/AsnC family transcriptional regulator [Actinomycetota bacterium]
MATPSDFDHLDALIASALQINGRASWGAIARAVDVPERTVARRGQRLLDMGAVRVSTYLDTTIVGNARPLVIEIRTEAGQAMTVAKAVAARADASSVSIVEGSGEIVCMLLPRTPADSAQLLLSELPAIDGLVSTQVSTVLRYFRSGFDWVGVPLSDTAVAELQYESRAGDRVIAPGGVLSAEDDALIAKLAADGRASVVTLAGELGVSAPTVRRRLDALLGAGALHVRTEISPTLHGLRVEALTWLRVSPDQIEAVGEALGQHPAVRFCVSCTGTSQLMIDCLVADEHALFTFLTKDVAALGVEGIARTSVVLVPVRRGPMVLADT